MSWERAFQTKPQTLNLIFYSAFAVLQSSKERKKEMQDPNAGDGKKVRQCTLAPPLSPQRRLGLLAPVQVAQVFFHLTDPQLSILAVDCTRLLEHLIKTQVTYRRRKMQTFPFLQCTYCLFFLFFFFVGGEEGLRKYSGNNCAFSSKEGKMGLAVKNVKTCQLKFSTG